MGIWGFWFWGFVLFLEDFLVGALVTAQPHSGDGSRAGALGPGRGGITCHDPVMHGEKNEILIIKRELLNSLERSPSG